MIDGRFDDWDGAPAQTLVGSPDVAVVSIELDAHAVYLQLTLRAVTNVQGRTSPLLLAFDSDTDPATGQDAFGVAGVDLVVSLSYLAHDGEVRQGVAAWRPSADAPGRTSAPRDPMVPHDVGLWFEPRHSASTIELRLARGSGSMGDFADGGFVARVVSVSEAGEELARSSPFGRGADVVTPAAGPAEMAGRVSWPRVEAGRLERDAGTALRVIVWNVAGRLADEPDPARRVLAALDPDLVLLDEVTSGQDAEAVEAILPAGDPTRANWDIHVGTSGGRQRGIIAARGSVTPAASFDFVPYADEDGGAMPGRLPGPVVVRAGVPATGAHVEIGGRTVFAVVLDLVCCGNSADSPQDRVRSLESAAINRSVREALGDPGAVPVLVGGDFNLVGSSAPLRRMGEGLAGADGDLVEVYALQLDGASSATWAGPTTPFPPGQLDYLLHPAGSMRPVRAFVFETSDLVPAALASLGLRAEDSDDASDHRPLVVDFAWLP
ncbi:MAG: endonuclease/exonuclease/phosphatase family protein [Gemmatimonadota bacterium]|nr:endonuclease/exonuclease/phosphatase family protein [Gemmatimonadota bacterium]